MMELRVMKWQRELFWLIGELSGSVVIDEAMVWIVIVIEITVSTGSK